MAIQHEHLASGSHPTLPMDSRSENDLRYVAENLQALSDKIQELSIEFQRDDACQERFGTRSLEELVPDIAGFRVSQRPEPAVFQQWGEGVLMPCATKKLSSLRHCQGNARYEAISSQVAGRNVQEKLWREIREMYRVILQQLIKKKSV
ncbi:hypothetical protein QFC19_000121 [Naganishia cerealis]|uniref:Uncharacterized protein n=1 Tax=Naganishia cerealis TaxID=610337 RepID=A0ACC2WS55_9TREE|nr:hypothetical protein QFC19_000121 [Naganishia cerealis]